MIGCQHVRDITDQHEGTIICIDCGVVKDVVYDIKFYEHSNFEKINSFDEVENILDQLHIPRQYSEIINSSIYTKKKKARLSLKSLQKTSSIKKIVTAIYNNVNEKHSNLLLKDITNFSHLEPSQIRSKDILIVNVEEILERYTKKFDLDFKSTSAIKEKISQFNNTGYQPLTIIGGIIYLYHIEIKKKISMKKIATVLGISSISIQRFIKKTQNAISSRSRVTTR